jgi:NMT1-like family
MRGHGSPACGSKIRRDWRAQAEGGCRSHQSATDARVWAAWWVPFLHTLGGILCRSRQISRRLQRFATLRYNSLENTPESLAALRKVFPNGYLTLVEPAPALVGIQGPTTIMAYSAYLVTNSHVSDEVVYKVTKALYENKAALASASATMKRFDPAVMAEANEVPAHPGAEKFYQEVKMWPSKQR